MMASCNLKALVGVVLIALVLIVAASLMGPQALVAMPGRIA